MSYKINIDGAEEFFNNAIKKWSILIDIFYSCKDLRNYPIDKCGEANAVLAWFQDNYSIYNKFSNFGISEHINGKEIPIDSVFHTIYAGSYIENIMNNQKDFQNYILGGSAQLRGHLSSVKFNKHSDIKSNQEKINQIYNTLIRFHSVVVQLKRVKGNKNKYVIEDEYDIQTLLHSLLKLHVDDISKEEWTPKYAGGAARIDLLLRKENIIIEVKYARESLKEKEIGDQLIIDIEKYKQFPNIKTMICFIYDPFNCIENPQSLKDIYKQEKDDFKIHVVISPPEY